MSGRSALLLGVLLVAPLSLASTTTPGAQAPATASASRQSPALPHPEIGRPLIRNFPPSEYGGGAQNWAFVQDRRGILYVGSASGILEYDSTSWRRIELPNRSTVRSLAQDSNGRIYAGGVSDFGYLDPASKATTWRRETDPRASAAATTTMRASSAVGRAPIGCCCAWRMCPARAFPRRS